MPIIGGKRYDLASSTLLCAVTDFEGERRLYHTAAGNWLIVHTDIFSSTHYEVIDEPSARCFMDTHADGIIEENYIAIFGEPEQG